MSSNEAKLDRLTEEAREVAEAKAAVKKGQRERADAFADSLRQFADFIEQNPSFTEHIGSWSPYVYAKDRAQLATIIRTLGSCRKQYISNSLYVEKDFGKHLELNVTINREKVCRKIVTGTRVIPARAELIPERVEEIIEWDCTDPLLADVE